MGVLLCKEGQGLPVLYAPQNDHEQLHEQLHDHERAEGEAVPLDGHTWGEQVLAGWSPLPHQQGLHGPAQEAAVHSHGLAGKFSRSQSN